MVPTFYHTNLFALGSLSGSTSGLTNPPERIADGDIGLVYVFTTGDPSVGVVQLTLSAAQLPDALVLARVEQTSGFQLTLESEDVGGANNVLVLNELLDETTHYVFPISGSSARQVWRLTLSATVTGLAPAKIFEAVLADIYQLPRPNEVGVRRSRVRQVNRIDIPGGQPFTQKMGPVLQENVYSCVLLDGTSGEEVAVYEEFVNAIDNGGSIWHIDDRGVEFWAEVIARDSQDEAGVFSLDIGVREVRVNGMVDEPR